MKNEGDVKKEVKKVLAKFGTDAWYYMPVQTGYGVKGVPDFVCCVCGIFVGIETKFGGNTLSVWQHKQIGAVQAARGVVFVINEKNVHELESLLNAVVALNSNLSIPPEWRIDR